MSKSYSDFHPVIGDSGKACRDLQGSSFLERWTSNFQSGLEIINSMFNDLETEFIAERDQVSQDPDWPYSVETSHDLTMLKIRRNHLAADLIRQAKEKYHRFVKERCRMPIELPPVRDLWQESLDKLIADNQSRCKDVA